MFDTLSKHPPTDTVKPAKPAEIVPLIDGDIDKCHHRPKLIEAFNDINDIRDIREYGRSIDKLIDIHEQVLPLVDQISAILVQAGAEQSRTRSSPAYRCPTTPRSPR